MRLTWFALGLFVGAGAACALVVYAHRLKAYEEAARAQAAARAIPAPPPVPPIQPSGPTPPTLGGIAKVREIARERAAKPAGVVN